jgi:adenosine deaminase
MNNIFIDALKQKDLETIEKIPKGDLHNHAPRGGNVSTIEKWAGVKIDRLDYKFNNLNEMQEWYERNIKCYCIGLDGYEIRIRGAFEQAKRDGVSKLVLTFGLGEEVIYGSLSNFAKAITDIHNDIAPTIEFIPELALGWRSNIDDIYHICAEYFNFGFYKSIDINGFEMAQPISNFRPVYQLAKSHGMRLRAHIGEFSSADSIREAVEVLELNEVQHGIAAASCKSTMKWLANNNIQLNVCPASNISLNRSKDYRSHQIRTLFDEGLKVTINTDDMIIFNASISEMYLNFFNERVFTAEELDIVREYSLG